MTATPPGPDIQEIPDPNGSFSKTDGQVCALTGLMPFSWSMAGPKPQSGSRASGKAAVQRGIEAPARPFAQVTSNDRLGDTVQ